MPILNTRLNACQSVLKNDTVAVEGVGNVGNSRLFASCPHCPHPQPLLMGRLPGSTHLQSLAKLAEV
jgi:hypothetical protein